MDITVVICTWNRAALLDRTLAEMRQLVIPADVEWELLVVNNCCTDETDDVLARHAVHLPLRRLFEPQPGKAWACNRAVREARGELILWTDDDVLVDADWLAAYVEAAHNWPDAAYFGGVVDPWFESTPPTWMTRNMPRLAMAFADYPAIAESRLMRDGEAPYGANMATRRAIFEHVGFDVRLGPTGTNQVRGEETALVRELRRRGMGGVRLNTARVRHFVPRQRLSVSYIWNYFVGHGRTCVRTGPADDSPQWCGVPRWLVRQYGTAIVRAAALRLVGASQWPLALTEAATARGMIQEYRQQRRQAAGNHRTLPQERPATT